MENEEPIDLKCLIKKDRDITCSITQEQFDEIQKEEINPNRIIFDIQEELD